MAKVMPFEKKAITIASDLDILNKKSVLNDIISQYLSVESVTLNKLYF